MTVTPAAATVASIKATHPGGDRRRAPPRGSHTVAVTSQDAFGNVGAAGQRSP